MKSGINVFIEEDFTMYAVKVHVIERRGSDDVHYNVSADGTLVETIVKGGSIGQNLKPFMLMPREFSEAFLLAFTKTLMSNGIRTESESHLEGKLKATEDHLTDMQTIVTKLLKL